MHGREVLSFRHYPAYQSVYSDFGYHLLRFLGLAGGLGGGVPPVWRVILPVALQGSGVDLYCISIGKPRVAGYVAAFAFHI